MTAKEHNKLLGIFFAVQAGLGLFGLILIPIIYGGLGIGLMNSSKSEDQTMGGIFLVLAIVFIPIGLLLTIPALMTALKMLKNKPGARTWGIIAACLALLSFPLGTALGIYALWFLMSDQGKAFYAGDSLNSNLPPPPPNSWQ